MEPTGDATASEALLEQVAEISQQLAEAEHLDEVLQLIVDLGEEYLDGCDGVSLMLIGKGGRVSSPAYSSQVAYESDLAQYSTDEGPCLDALREDRTFIIDDLETEERWPDYRTRALELGVRSMISFRLFTRADTMGALDFYAATPHVFGRRAQLIGQVFAAHASVALKTAINEAGYENAIRSRDVIGQAKGIIMERERVGPQRAFQRLRTASQRLNKPVFELAELVVATGELPE